MRHNLIRPQRGQVTVLALGFALVMFSVAGVAVDGTRAFLLRRSLQNSVDGAALAGAAELDRDVYYRSGGETTVLDEEAARRTAAEWLVRRGLGAEARVATTPTSVVVILRGEVAATFLGLAGIGSIPVAARARAAPVSGRP